MNPFRYILLATILFFLCASAVFSQGTSPKTPKKLNKESVKSEEDKDSNDPRSAGLKKLTHRSEEYNRGHWENIDVNIDVEAIEATVAEAVESALESLEVSMASIDNLHVEPIEVNIPAVDIEPIEVNIPAINIPALDINIEPIGPIEINLDMDDDDDQGDEKIDKDKDKEKVKEKDKGKKSDKEKEKERSKGLVKIKKGS